MEQFPAENEIEKEFARAELAGLCHELLTNTIPQWFSVAQNYEKALENARDEVLDQQETESATPKLNPRVDSTYISFDYKFEDIASLRLRLVPQALRQPYKNEILGEVKTLIINIPNPFITNLETIDDFQLAILTINGSAETAGASDENKKSYILTSTDIMPIDDFNNLDLQFEEEEKTEKNIVLEVKVTSPQDNETNEQPPSEDSYEQLLAKRNLANAIYAVISKYRLGNQSRTDGTM